MASTFKVPVLHLLLEIYILKIYGVSCLGLIWDVGIESAEVGTEGFHVTKTRTTGTSTFLA